MKQPDAVMTREAQIRCDVLTAWHWADDMRDRLHCQDPDLDLEEYGCETALDMEEYLQNHDLTALCNAADWLHIPVKRLERELINDIYWK